MKNRIYIKHAISGRIRFKMSILRYNKKAIHNLEEHLKGVKGIIMAGGNPKSGSLVVRYDGKHVSQESLIRIVKDFSVPGICGCSKNIAACMPSKSDRESSLKSAIIHFIGVTLLAVMVLFREIVLKKPLVQNFFSLFGMLTSIAALPLIKKGIKNLKEKRITLESFLGGSIFIAVIAGEAMAALEILWITTGSTLLGTWITERSRQSIRDILQLTSKNTFILAKGVEVEVAVNEVQCGDTVVLHTGEKVSVDGTITRGEAVIDESSITGISEPAPKNVGDKIFAGSFVRQGVVFVLAEEVGDKTYLARILRMVEDSLETKAPIEGVADRLAGNLIKAGFAVTLATLILTRNLWRTFTVMLVMACPCATILAASTAISAAINAAAKRHILIKGGRYLEEVGKADIVCFDKTGTLTTNEPEIRQIITLDGMAENDLIQIACSAEMHNFHPIAITIKVEAQKRKIEAVSHDVCEYMPGKGVRSEIDGEEILIGSSKLMDQFEVNHDAVREYLLKFKNQGLTLIFIAKSRKLAGIMGFANRYRQDAADVIRFLKQDGVKKIVMITGDSKYSARDATEKLDLSECHFSVMPEEKSDIIAGLKKCGDKTLMVGDGINDALALAEADIGVAMGAGGSEVAIEAADIALVNDDLKGIVYVRSLSRQTIQVVHQNFWIATGSNVAGVVLGALGLLSPVAAGLIHIAHTLGVLANSGRLLFYDPAMITDAGEEAVKNLPGKPENG